MEQRILDPAGQVTDLPHFGSDDSPAAYRLDAA